MGFLRRLILAPVACVAIVACEQPPDQIPADGGGGNDAFPWADAAPRLDTDPSSDGGGADTDSDAGPPVDAGGDAGVPLPYTVVVLPDTQYYSSNYPDFFDMQTAWIVAEHAAGNIAFVLHEGDIVDDDVAPQWTRAYHSIHMLDGVVPYVLTAGNHDFCCGGWPSDRTTMINAYFPVSTFEGLPSFKGTFEPGRIENSAHLFDVPGGAGRWLVISVEFGPRDTVLAWANDVVKQYADTPAMLVTHAYLYDDDTRYDHVARPNQFWNPHSYPIGMNQGDANDGEEMWQKLVLGNSNIRFVISGHVLNSGVGRLSSTRPDGTVVHQILANYQILSQGGQGYLRVMQFFPAERSVHVRTFSPALGLFMNDPRNDFTLAY
jgi:calcineurin-like phosphoesterase family protein